MARGLAFAGLACLLAPFALACAVLAFIISPALGILVAATVLVAGGRYVAEHFVEIRWSDDDE